MTKRPFFYGFTAAAVLLISSACALSQKVPEAPQAKPYEIYDQRVKELEAAVTSGGISVGEAEMERRKAFRTYLSALGNETVANEYRNY